MLFLTYRCTAECSYCFAASSTRKGKLMEVADVREYIEEAQKAGATWVSFFGGEPFFHFDLLKEGIKHARRIGLETAIASNAFWAPSEKSALERLRLLKEIGLREIAISSDPFHCEYVPLEHIRNAIKAAKTLDMFAYSGVTAFDEEDGDAVVRRAREIAARLLPHEIYGGKIGGIGFTGTAAEVLAERAPKQSWKEYARPCHMVDFIESGGLANVSVDPYGYVSPRLICLGISMGNARETKLSEIIARYEPHGHPILGPLHEEGPAGLAKTAMKYGFEPTEYADECHLCYEARKALLDHYPEHLAPAVYYERAE